MGSAPHILLTFVGDRDPYIPGSDDPGPVLSLLEVRAYDEVFLVCTGSAYLERGRLLEQIAADREYRARFRFLNLELSSPIDYEEIYAGLSRCVSQATESLAHAAPSYAVLLDPGTPQMQTSWFLLVRSGAFQAQLLQGVPPRFAGGSYKVKEVELDSGVLPEIRPPAALSDTSPGRHAAAPGEERGAGDADLIAQDPAFRDLLTRAERAARYDVSVLICGETGAGKGVIAKYLHGKSTRRAGHFVSVNCSAISATLAESELFGHVKGSFTGAVADRLGQFRAAEGGTLFLDEVGDLPLELQPKLLRALEEKRITPLGADREYPVDVRVIAATNKDLPAMIEEGGFRRDLYERLNQVRLSVPPLRTHPQDIPELADHFLAGWNRKYHESRSLSPEAVEAFKSYSWPGNVRELSNAVQAMCATAAGDELSVDVLPPEIHGAARENGGAPLGAVRIPEEGLQLRSLLAQVERAYYSKALERTGGNREQAAALLGINAPAFRKALRERFGEE